jgi:hypothetical protein
MLAVTGFELYGLSYKNAVLGTPGLLAYWPLDELSGTVANDISGNGYNAAYVGTPTLGAASIETGLTKSVSLNGSSQYVEVATPPAALQIVNGSFEGWWQPSVIPTASGTGGAIINNSYTYPPGNNINVGLGFDANTVGNNPGYATFGNYTASNTTWYYITGTSNLVANTPYHMVGVNDGTNLYLYINGVLVATGAANTFTPTANAILMGAGDNGGYLTGLLSNVAMYSSYLTAAQVLQHYNAGIG